MQTKRRKPAAFMSYVHSDDKYERLTQFRKRLSDEVHMQIGEEFSIFQDRNDILWGQNWQERIEESIDEVTFLIPIITPSFFNSSACRDELQRFIKREKKLKRNDLILPVYYVDSPLLNDEEKREGDELSQVIAARQYADWRELRFEPFTSPQVGKTLARLAVQIRDALERVQALQKTEVPESAASITRRPAEDTSIPLPLDIKSVIESREITRRPTAKTEPPIRVVDQMHRGDHVTITEAIEAANPGDRILVRPGLYQEGLIIEKPLEIIGDGNPGDVVVLAVDKDALLFKTMMGRVVNLTLRQMGVVSSHGVAVDVGPGQLKLQSCYIASGGYWYGVGIAQGRLELEGCDITSKSLPCVAIHDGADPHLHRNRIHDGKGGGVLVYDNGRGTLEDNDIFGNTYSGVGIREGGNPTLRRNRIHDSEESGVLVYEHGLGTLEDNDIFGNTEAGVAIMEGGSPTLRRNRIHDGESFGVSISDGGGGTIEDNDLRDNARGAWNVSADSEPNLKRARNKE